MNKSERTSEEDDAFAVLYEIGEQFADIDPEEIEREVAKAVAEVRAENRRREGKARSA